MMLTKYWHWVKGNLKTSKRLRPVRGFRPSMEPLEPRCLLSATDVVMEWNAVAIEAAKEDHAIGAPGLQFGPTRTSRALAIEAIAASDSGWGPGDALCHPERHPVRTASAALDHQQGIRRCL